MRCRSTERTLGLTGLLLLAAYAVVAVVAVRWLARCEATCAAAGGRTAGVALVALFPLALAGVVLCARAAARALSPGAARTMVALSRAGLYAGALGLAVVGFVAVRQTAPLAGAGACLLAWTAVLAAWRLP